MERFNASDDRRVSWLIAESKRLDRGRPEAPHEREAWEIYRRHAARALLEERRALRDEARRRTRDALIRASQGRPGALRRVAQLVLGRDPRGLVKELAWLPPASEVDAPEVLERVAYAAAVMLRHQGQLEVAYALFGQTYARWNWWDNAPIDERYPAPPRWWRHGVPRVYEADGTLRWETEIPVVGRVDWRSWDHVIGCGTRIDRAELDHLGVPRSKQHVIEVHRTLPYVVGPIPRLHGRVVVVDDVHEGETSQRLARLVGADVVAVGHEWQASLAVAGGLPVLAVDD